MNNSKQSEWVPVRGFAKWTSCFIRKKLLGNYPKPFIKFRRYMHGKQKEKYSNKIQSNGKRT